MRTISTKAEDVLYKRQLEEDPFLTENYYNQEGLIQPPYGFAKLYQIYEESDVLQGCVDAMQQNVDGFGYGLQFLGDDVKEKDKPEAKTEHQKLENFFDYANEEQSWMTIRKQMREDYEVLGQGALEVVRNLSGAIQLVYYLPMKHLRQAKLDLKPQTVTIAIPRNGKIDYIKVKKYFRRFCQISSSGKKLRWFKSFGDPRPMNALTGVYSVAPRGAAASEVIFVKHAMGGSTYGFPRWIGAIMDAMGRTSASFVNYDLFNSQGIPPMAVMVSNGVLTDDSVKELEAIIRGLRGVEEWNRVMLLESNPQSLGMEDKGSARIELKNLTEYRKEDMMFDTYLTNTERHLRHTFRLPPLYVGATETYTLATSKVSQVIAEEQVFIPERETFDEFINATIVQRELDCKLWKYHTKGPRIVGAEEVSKSVEVFTKSGAFSVNHSIGMANEAFGLTMSKYNAPWADYPLPLVIKLLEAGLSVQGMEDVAKAPPTPKPIAPAPQKLITQKSLPYYVPEKIIRSDFFSDEEKVLYKKLLMVQDALERADVETGEEL